MELLRLAAVLARRRFVVLESIAFFTMVAVLVALLVPRTYTASARVLIAPSDTTASVLTDLDLAEIATGMTAASKDIENHIALATTRPVLDEVIWRLQLRDRSGRLYDAHEILSPGLLSRFFAQPSVTVSPQQGTHLLVFTASAPDPETARLLADTVVGVAIETTGAHAQAESRRARELVEEQLDLVKKELGHALEPSADSDSEQGDPAQGVYETLAKQRYQIAVAEQIRLSDLQLVEAAGTPARPSFPRPWFQIAMGLLLGSLVGVGSALLLEYVDDSVKTPEDLAAACGIRPLGVVPRFDGDPTIDGRPLTDPLAESWRTIRSAASHAGRDKPLVRIAVTSPMAGDGKSTGAWNLAVSYAREGKRVLLVDGDLRRPSLHGRIGGANETGLTRVLLGEATLADAVRSTAVPGLSLLPSGPPTADPARLVESLRLRQLLLEIEETCDVAIVDTPPVLAVNDALVIARAVDGLVLIVESGKTSRRQLAEATARLSSAAIVPLGAVLNKVPLEALGYRPYLSARRAGGAA
jgi:capsular exopolysaccharide synthesis family protein